MVYFKRELLSYFSPISICCIYLLISDIVSMQSFAVHTRKALGVVGKAHKEGF